MNNPKVWDQLLAGSPEGSVLMGGAVVDYIASMYMVGETQPKDYDIFHRYTPGMPDVSPAWEYIEMDYNNPHMLAKHDADYLDHEGQIGSVYNFDVLVDDGFEYGKVRVQMIGVNYADPRDHFPNFDHSLTLGSYSDNGLFVHSKVFESLRNKTIEYVSKLPYKPKSWTRAAHKALRYDAMNFAKWKYINFPGM